MTEVYDLFAFAYDGEDIRRQRIPVWKLGTAARWAADQGADIINFQRADGAPSSTRLITHHMCNDPDCPGGC